MLNLSPSAFLASLITLIFAFTLHEFSHAWTATQFGDETPQRYGRLTLNPLSHLDPMGSLMLLLTGFGWAKPVPVNLNRIRQHSRAAPLLVALSGPFSNFLLALAASLPLRFGLVRSVAPRFDFFPTAYEFLVYFFFTNLGLMLFNLIPLPPLDGEEILIFFLPTSLERVYENIRPYGPYILIVLLFLGPLVGFSLIDSVLSPAIFTLGRILLGGF